MKNIFLLLALAAFSFFGACKKEKQAGPASFPGIYEGKWGAGNDTPANFFKFEFKSDGSLIRLDEQGQTLASGNWMVDGVQFECTYTHTAAAGGQTHKIGGLYTDFDGLIIGTWGYSPSKVNGGNIELTKQ